MSTGTGGSGGGSEFVESGSWGEVRHARRMNGRMEAKEWLDSATLQERAKFAHLFRSICNGGRPREELFRHLDGPIWEFKKDANRILCFQVSNCWRLTHHYQKKSKKCPRSQMDRAKTIRNEFLGS